MFAQRRAYPAKALGGLGNDETMCTSYNRKFIINFSVMAVPLTYLTKKGKAYIVLWTENQKEVFQMRCKLLSSFHILRILDLTKARREATDRDGDWTSVVTGAKRWEMSCYICESEITTKGKGYSTMVKECLAKVWCIFVRSGDCLRDRSSIISVDDKCTTSKWRVMRWPWLYYEN